MNLDSRLSKLSKTPILRRELRKFELVIIDREEGEIDEEAIARHEKLSGKIPSVSTVVIFI